MTDLPGFADLNTTDVDDVEIKKKSKKGGGFQSLGLSFNVLKGITKRGYKIPTPIQRKVGNTYILEKTKNDFFLDYSISIRRKRFGGYGTDRQWKNSLFLNTTV